MTRPTKNIIEVGSGDKLTSNFGVGRFMNQLHNSSMDAGFANSASRRPPGILLVDDSAVERIALAHFLRRAGYQVDEVADGQAAIEHLKNREVDLILLDLQMPDVDGFGVLNYLYTHRRGLPVVLLSGMPVDLIQLKMHGLTQRELPPLFLKPVDLDQLLQVLDLQLAGQMPDLPASSTPDEVESPSSTSNQTNDGHKPLF